MKERIEELRGLASGAMEALAACKRDALGPCSHYQLSAHVAMAQAHAVSVAIYTCTAALIEAMQPKPEPITGYCCAGCHHTLLLESEAYIGPDGRVYHGRTCWVCSDSGRDAPDVP